jgi:hypothetical protein
MDPSNPRKATGGKIEYRISMRQPLLKAHVVKKTHQWMTVSFGGPSPTNVEASVLATMAAVKNEATVAKPEAIKPIEKKDQPVKPEAPVSAPSVAAPIPAATISKLPSPVKETKRVVTLESPPAPDVESLELAFNTYQNLT